MLAALGATAPPQNLLKIIFGTKTPFCFALTRHKPCLFIALNPAIPRDLAGTTRRIDLIGIIAIVAPAILGLRALPWALGSTQPRLQLKTIVIVAATGQCVGKIGTRAGPPITIITKSGILLTNILSPVSLKTSIDLGNLLVGDWC